MDWKGGVKHCNTPSLHDFKMLFRPLLLLALSILAADALHSSTPPARKLTGAMAALRGSGASERLQQTPALRALRGGSDDTMAVNFVWLSCSSVALSSMVRLLRETDLLNCVKGEATSAQTFLTRREVLVP